MGELLEELKVQKAKLESEIGKLRVEKGDLVRIVERTENDIKLLRLEKEKAVEAKRNAEIEYAGAKAKIDAEINKLNSAKSKLENDRLKMQEEARKEKDNLGLLKQAIEESARQRESQISQMKLEAKQEMVRAIRELESSLQEFDKSLTNNIFILIAKSKKALEKVK